MSRSPPSWHAECRARRAAGWTLAALAEHFGKSAWAVRLALDEAGERQRASEASQRWRSGHTRERRSANPPRDSDFVAPHVARQPRRVIAEEMVMPAAREFAAGKIDRATLMARIRGEAS
jgi:hypothetical protein